jgi:hypothetical protein
MEANEVWLAGVFGLVAVAVGFVLSLMAALWQRVLDGQAAARLIRVESIANRTKIIERAPPSYLTKHAWETHAAKIVPFLEELELMRIGQSYNEMARIGLLIEIEARSGKTDRGRRRIIEWVEREKKNGALLRNKIERAKPWNLFPKLLWPRRVATSKEIRDAYGLGDGVDGSDGPVDELDQPNGQAMSATDEEIRG